MKETLYLILVIPVLISCSSSVSETSQDQPSIIVPSINGKQNYLNQIICENEDAIFPLKSPRELKKEQISNVVISDSQEVKDYVLKTSDSMQFLCFPINCSVNQVLLSIADKEYRFPVSIYYEQSISFYEKEHDFHLAAFNIMKTENQQITYRFEDQINLPDVCSIIGPNADQSGHPFQYATASVYNSDKKEISNRNLAAGNDYLLTVDVSEDYHNYYFDGNIPFEIEVNNQSRYIKPGERVIPVLSALSEQEFEK